ncbi:hypothetical protein [Anaerophaga thermohalophila]|uniref:hypothetical protein n=1 Tax=Anaerophaga thermohalophila TaxID=177400 RepID=UPI00030EF89B|nr:hypothetical protein [Anaerophaga thermohalophila]
MSVSCNISNLNAAGNEYFWFEYPDAIGAEYYEEMWGETENPELTVVLEEETLKEKYYCKVFNPNAPTYTPYWDGSTYVNPVLRYLNTDTISFALLTQDDVLNEKYPDKHIISSGDIKNGEYTNPVTQDFRSSYIHTITDEIHTMKLKNVVAFSLSDYDPLTGKTMEFTTSSTEKHKTLLRNSTVLSLQPITTIREKSPGAPAAVT